MKCAEARKSFSPFLDSVADGKQMRALDEHLRSCADCQQEFTRLRLAHTLLASVGKKQTPPDLVLRLKVAASQQLAAKRISRWESIRIHWTNALNAFMVPATAGMVTAVIIFGLLMGVLVPAQISLQASNDVPTLLYTPPELAFAPFGLDATSNNGDATIVEASIDANGRLQDYTVLSSPEGKDISPDLKNALLFTQFKPATSFGQRVSGKVILSFARINVHG